MKRVGLGVALTGYILRNRIRNNVMFPLFLILEVAHRCNLACKGCGRIYEFAGNRDFVRVEEACSAALMCPAPIVYVSGGEPLLHPRINQIIRGLLDMSRFVFVCTNGLLLLEALDQFEPDPYLCFLLHLDGLESTHDMLTDQSGTFSEVMKAIQLAKKRNFQVRVMTTLYRDTKSEEIGQLLRNLKELGVDGVFISPGFAFKKNARNIFLSRKEVAKRFGQILLDVKKNYGKFICNTPDYFSLLASEKKPACEPFRAVTWNRYGWKSPCYGITDAHCESYGEYLEETDWKFFGKRKHSLCGECALQFSCEATILSSIEGLGEMFDKIPWAFNY